MSEAPEFCEKCPIDSHDVYGVRSCGESIGEERFWQPGPGCPFVRLDFQEGKILVLKNQLIKAQREATELAEILDENNIDFERE